MLLYIWETTFLYTHLLMYESSVDGMDGDQPNEKEEGSQPPLCSSRRSKKVRAREVDVVLTNSLSAIEANFEYLQSGDEVTENATNAVRSLTIP